MKSALTFYIYFFPSTFRPVGLPWDKPLPVLWSTMTSTVESMPGTGTPTGTYSSPSFYIMSLQFCGSGSGIRCLFNPWIRIQDGKSGSGIQNQLPGSAVRTPLVAVTERVTVPIQHIVLVNKKLDFLVS
jgi:hypothetical protein